MTRLLILILIIIVIGYLWYQWQARKAVEQERAAQQRLAARTGVERSPLPPLAGMASPSVDGGVSAAERVGAGGAALLQEAADAAAGLDLKRATGEMDLKAAELASARRDAEAAAARLADKADDALAEVQAAADPDSVSNGEFVRDDLVARDDSGVEIIEVDAMLIRDREAGDRNDLLAEAIAAADAGSVPPGAIRGDGGRVCPPTYPIKGNEQTMLYHAPENPTYQATVPELCFSTVDAALTAGYAEAKH